MGLEYKAKYVEDWLYRNRATIRQSDLADEIGISQGVLSAAIRLERYGEVLDKAIKHIEEVEGIDTCDGDDGTGITYNDRNQCVYIDTGNHYQYEIDLETITAKAHLIGQIHHLSDKMWVNTDMIHDLIEKVCEIKGWSIYCEETGC